MAKVEVKASGLWRVLEIVGGLIVTVAAVVAFLDPQFVVNAFVILIASALVIGGLFRIGVGVSAVILPSTLRALNTAGGIIAVVLGIAALLDLGAAVAALIAILALALLLVGAFEIGVGVARHPPMWLRVTIIVLGVLTVVLAGIVVIDTSLGVSVLATLLALALLLVGIRNLVHGFTGHHPVTAPIDVSVTGA